MIEQDPLCEPNFSNQSVLGNNPPILDSSLFPTYSSFSDPNFNILPFLCQLLKVADNENIDPVLVPPAEFDDSKHVNFSMLTGVGDRRFSDGAILSAAFIKFLPRIITQMEVGRSGGNQIIDNYICDSDGNPIKQSLTIPLMTTVGTGGVNILGYDIPTGLNPDDLMKPMNGQEVFDFVNEYILQQSQLHADAFVLYLMKYYPITSGWSYSLHAFKNPPFFYIQLDKYENKEISNSIYLKYYDNVQDYVAKKLSNIGYIDQNASIDVRIGATFDNNAVCKAFLTPVPDYTSLLYNENAAIENNKNAQEFYSSTPNEQFNILKDNTGISIAGMNQTFNLIDFIEKSKY